MSGTGSSDDQGGITTPLPAEAGAAVDKTTGSEIAGSSPGSPAAEAGDGPEAATVAAAEGAEGHGSSAPAAGEGAKPAEPAKAPDNSAWKAKKYDTVYAKLKATEAELEAARSGQGKPDSAAIEAAARQLAATTEFNKRCNDVAEGAKKKYTDWGARIGDLQHLKGDGKDASLQQAYGNLIAAALETGEEADRVIYELGGNLEEAERIMNLSPVKQAKALTALAAKRGEPEPSAAPKPITPLGQRGANEDIKPEDAAKADKLSTKTWMDRRQADVDKKRASGMRIW